MVVLLAFTTVWTENVGPFREKATANQRRSAPLTSKTIVMPMTIFEGDVTRTTHTYGRTREGISSDRRSFLFVHLPVIGFVHEKHFLANSRAKHSAQ